MNEAKQLKRQLFIFTFMRNLTNSHTKKSQPTKKNPSSQYVLIPTIECVNCTYSVWKDLDQCLSDVLWEQKYLAFRFCHT